MEMSKFLTWLFFAFILLPGCGQKGAVVVPENEEKEDEELSNVIVRMIVLDSKGNNLLDPHVEGTFAGSDALYADFRGESFYLNQDINDNDLVPEVLFLGLFSEHYDGFPYRLLFGGLDPYSDIEETLTIHWPTGSSDIVTIISQYDATKNHCQVQYFLNGIEVEESFTIVIN